MAKIIDISLKIDEKMIVFPSNPKPEFKQYSKIPTNQTNETLISFGSHTGTHFDAPRHVSNHGKKSLEIPLDKFYGKCKVLDFTREEQFISKEVLMKFDIKKNDIILLKTKNSLIGYEKFRKDYVYVSKDAAEYLIEKKIKTIGIDYLSIKRFGTDDDVHEMLINSMVVIEGLDLRNAEAGEYIFSGFPLKYNSDAGLLRAVLIKD